MQQKITTPRKRRASKLSIITRREAHRLFNLINDQSIDSQVRFEIGETCDVIKEDSPITDTWQNESLFIEATLEGWQQRPSKYRRYWQGKIRAILDRTKAGESPAAIIADLKEQAEKRQHQYVEQCARKFIKDTTTYTKGTRAALSRALECGNYQLLYETVNRARDGVRLHPTGEPVNRLSSEWRYWKIRQIERAFNGDDRADYQAAWDEFRALLSSLMAEDDFWHTYFARNLLPYLIEARQHIDGLNLEERRSQAGMKAAKARKTK
jgi:hypothetical protein